MLISRVGVNQRVPVDLIPEISSRALSLTKRNWWGPGQPINKITELRSWWIHCFLPLIPVVKAMAPHSRTLAWKIPWMEEPGRLQSMGSLGVRYDWATSLYFHFHALEKEMATHSSVLAWRIPGTGEPGGLPCMESHRVGHDWRDLAAAAAAASSPDDLPATENSIRGKHQQVTYRWRS